MNPIIQVFSRCLTPQTKTQILSLESKVASLFKTFQMTPSFHSDLTMNSGFHACLIGSGGCESSFLNYFSAAQQELGEKAKKYPFLLLAHGDLNSLAASLECAAKIKSLGGKSFLFNINETEKIKLLSKVLAARMKLNEARFGVIGKPSDWLISSNLTTLNGKAEFMGVNIPQNIIQIDYDEFLEAKNSVGDNDIELNNWTNDIIKNENYGESKEINGTKVLENMKLFVGLQKLKNKYKLNGLTLRCFDLIKFNLTGCLALSLLNDIGVPSACEGDIPSMFTMHLSYLLSNSPSFMANPIDFNDRTLKMAHCTIARNLTAKYKLRTHFESNTGIGIQADLKTDEPIWTLSRLDLQNNEMFNEEVTIKNVEHKSEKSCRTQIDVEFKGRDDLMKFLENASGNHHILTPGRHKEAFSLFRKLFI